MAWLVTISHEDNLSNSKYKNKMLQLTLEYHFIYHPNQVKKVTSGRGPIKELKINKDFQNNLDISISLKQINIKISTNIMVQNRKS